MFSVAFMYESAVLIAFASSECVGVATLMRKHTRASAALVYKVRMYMKAQTKVLISNFAGFVSMGVYT